MATKKAATKPAKKTVKIAGSSFTKVSCSTAKTTAKKAAESIRSKGKKARVIKNGTAYCVYQGSASKTKRTTTKKK